MEGQKILIVEDDADISGLLVKIMEGAGYQVRQAFSGTEALFCMERELPDCVLLDLMLPGMTGEEVLEQIRQEQKKEMPVLILSAKVSVQDKVKLLRLGADDYITKPFDTELLLYKIKAILQRSAVLEDDEQEQFKISNIFFDSMLRQLRVGDNEYKLSPKENELLKLLCMHRNDFMPRDLALRKIWKKENYFTARSMDVYIAKLRKLLRDDEGLEIINVHGEGFRLLVKN